MSVTINKAGSKQVRLDSLKPGDFFCLNGNLHILLDYNKGFINFEDTVPNNFLPVAEIGNHRNPFNGRGKDLMVTPVNVTINVEYC